MALTLSQQVARVKRLARVSNSGAVTITDTDDVIKIYINEGVREFAKESNGEPAEDYLTLAPRFDTRTNYAIRVEIGSTITAADVAVTATDRDNVAGSTVASDLQTAIRAMTGAVGDETVTFTTSGTNIWTFIITDPTGGSITVSSPTDPQYVDAVSLLFGSADSAQDDTWRGDVGEDATVETALPSNYLSMEDVEWDRTPLRLAPWHMFVSPGTTGTPRYYAIKNDVIRVYPSPTSQKMFHIRFKEAPADLATDGTDDSTNCPLPGNEHMAPVYYAAAKLLEEQFDWEESDRHLRNFYRLVNLYKQREGNQTPTLFPSPDTARFWPHSVEVS